MSNIVGAALEAGAIAQLSNQLAGINNNVARVGALVDAVAAAQVTTHSELTSFINEFRTFVAIDAKHKELSIAETRLVKTRQEIDKRFGAHDEIRARATGILRSVDVAVVREETIRTATEELMLKSPRYWLAPALVALASWIGDRPGLAEKALAEALRRDDYKTSLFFALIARRAGRSNVAAIWLDRYFRLQDPYALDREVTVLLDAVALGAFGREAMSVLNSGVSTWLQEVSSNATFVQQEQARWLAAFENMRGPVNENDFPYLVKYSSSWPELGLALTAARGNTVVLNYLGRVFDGEIALPPSIQDRIDGILDTLVTDFDDEELDLRRGERHLELIVECNGDRAQADQKFNFEKGNFAEKASFVSILTSASFAQGGKSAASRATQRLSIALSKPWALEAHDEHVAKIRAERPQKAKISLESWSGLITSGQDEQRLVDDVLQHFTAEEKAALAKVWNLRSYIFGIIALITVFLAVFGIGWLYMTALCAMIQLGTYLSRRKRAMAIRAAAEQNRQAGTSIVRASVAEWVDYCDEWMKADAVSKNVRETFENLTPESFYAGDAHQRRIA